MTEWTSWNKPGGTMLFCASSFCVSRLKIEVRGLIRNWMPHNDKKNKMTLFILEIMASIKAHHVLCNFFCCSNTSHISFGTLHEQEKCKCLFLLALGVIVITDLKYWCLNRADHWQTKLPDAFKASTWFFFFSLLNQGYSHNRYSRGECHVMIEFSFLLLQCITATTFSIVKGNLGGYIAPCCSAGSL